nr:hypothetical protein [Tanacetum cinerariifolium]
QAKKKTVSGPQYVLLPLLTSDSQGLKSLEDEVVDDARKKSTKVPRKENEVQDPVKEDENRNRIFTLVSAAGSTYVYLGGSIPVNAATLPNADLTTDPLMPDLEDTADTRIYSDVYDDQVEGAEDQPIVQSSQHPEWFSQPKKPLTPDLDALTPELLAGPTYELMKGSCNSLIELEYHLEEVYKATTNQLDWINLEDYENIKWIEDLVPRSMWIQEPINYDKHALWGVSHWGRKRQQFYGFTVNWVSALDVYPKRRIIAVTDLKIGEWHNYKHLDWILVHRDDDKIYKFKEGNFKRLRLQDIKDMLLLLVQGKLSNLTVEERFIFNVSLRMFTRSIVIQRRVEDLQLGVKSYQKRLNLTKPDTYRSVLKRREAYTAYSNPRGFIYQNKDKKNRLMRIDELHKCSDGTLNDVRNALDDRLKGIRMQYLPQTIWRKGDKDRAAAMIQAIDKILKTRRIMRSLERFVGGRLYMGDFRMLQRTI